MSDANTTHKWYVVRTYSGHENKVKLAIESESKTQGLSERITRALVPAEKIFEVKDGKKKSKTKNLFSFFYGKLKYLKLIKVLDK